MYFGSSKKREAAKAAFQQEKNLDTGKLLHQNPPDVLIGLIRIMGTGLTLHQASVVIIMEPMYDPNLFLQVPKRAHRLGQLKEVSCYTIRANTPIEDMVEAKRKKKSGFGEKAFITVIEGQKDGKIHHSDVDTDAEAVI